MTLLGHILLNKKTNVEIQYQMCVDVLKHKNINTMGLIHMSKLNSIFSWIWKMLTY